MYEEILESTRCVQRLPADIRTWVQPSISIVYDRPGRWWVRVNRKSGCASPPERTILTFWCYDNNFEEFFRLFERRIRRILASGVRVASTPDISIYWRDSRQVAEGLFREQLKFGRKMQRRGLTILPNVPLLHPSYAEVAYSRLLPRDLPLALQIQTAMRPKLGVRDLRSIRLTAECLSTIIRVSRSPELLIYGTRSVFEAIVPHLTARTPLRFISCISDIMNDVYRAAE